MADKAEILSDAEVDFLLMAEKSAEQGAPAPAGDEQAVTMRGDLDQINLADIFQTLGMAKMEGVLRVRNPLEERQIHVRDGYLRAHVPARLATRRLGQRLVHAGLVQEEHLRAALIEQRTKKKPIGELLVEAGHVSQEAIDEIVGSQIAEDVFALFTWRHGTFEFYKGEPSAPLQQVFAGCPEYEIGSLLLEVARRADEWQTIFDALGSLDEVPCKPRGDVDTSECTDLEREVLAGITGKVSWRDISNGTTHGMFEVARTARDLVRAELAAPLADPDMVALAQAEADGGQPKRALVLVQTLRDRPGDRGLGILQSMAQILAAIGERRLAASQLLEAAQRHTDAESALTLARDARELAPHDVGTLSFLRTVLIAHAPADSPELERCSLDLLDALIEADLVPTALEIIEDARRTGTVQPQILTREVRARQKARDSAGAARVLEELATLYDSRGEPKLALETYEMLLRVDRSRKDVQKLLVQRRRTRVGRIVRVVAAISCTSMLAGMGVVFWQQHQFTTAVTTADQELTQLLDRGELKQAKSRLSHWAETLGNCEAIDDMRNRVAFAEAAEAGRLQKQWRDGLNAGIAAAAEQMKLGAIGAAFDRYEELARDDKARSEVHAVVANRIDALLPELTQALKGLQGSLAVDPASLLDRHDLARHRAEFESVCPTRLLVAFAELETRTQQGRLTALLDPERLERIQKLVADGKESFARARDVAAAFAAAWEKSDLQRRLDPVFKAAVECERSHDFAKALAHYRELERHTNEDATMRAHFRDRVARNATIVRLLEALRDATSRGDYDTAQQQLRALRLAFPDVPFDSIAQLPLRIESRPPGATVSSNGKPLGVTPLLLTRLPADSLRITVASDGFRGAERTFQGEAEAAWSVQLELPAQRTWKHDNPIEARVAAAGDRNVLVDRSGTVVALDHAGSETWRHRTGDLSGLLTTPVVHGDVAYVGSLDGELRALALADGTLRWSLGGLPTEVRPLLQDDRIVVVTTERELHSVAVRDRQTVKLTLPQVPVALAAGRGTTAFVLGDRGTLCAVDTKTARTMWQRDLPTRAVPRLAGSPQLVAVVDDSGHVLALDAQDGNRLWELQLDGETVGSPTLVGSDLFVPLRERIVRLAAATGSVVATLPRIERDFTGPVVVLEARLAVPVREGVQIFDRASGEALYRLAGARGAQAQAVGKQLWVIDAERSIQVFRDLR